MENRNRSCKEDDDLNPVGSLPLVLLLDRHLARTYKCAYHTYVLTYQFFVNSNSRHWNSVSGCGNLFSFQCQLLPLIWISTVCSASALPRHYRSGQERHACSEILISLSLAFIASDRIDSNIYGFLFWGISACGRNSHADPLNCLSSLFKIKCWYNIGTNGLPEMVLENNVYWLNT